MSKKDNMGMKLERLLNKEVKLSAKIRHSSNHIEDFAGYTGVLRDFDIGEDYEDIICKVEVVVVSGKKKDNRRNEIIWVDARDILGVEKE
jgi:hypothetical protein